MRISDWSSDVCSSDLQYFSLETSFSNSREERYRATAAENGQQYVGFHVGDLLGYRPIVPQAYWEHDLLGRCESGFFGCGNGGVTRYKAPRAFEYSAGERLAIWSDLACHFAAHPARDFKREADTIDAGPCFRRQHNPHVRGKASDHRYIYLSHRVIDRHVRAGERESRDRKSSNRKSTRLNSSH